MNKCLCLLMVTATMNFVATFAEATIYTWTGINDGDWNNTANWDTNGVPVDTDASTGLTFDDPASVIVFSAATLLSSNVPDFGGVNTNNGVTPSL